MTGSTAPAPGRRRLCVHEHGASSFDRRDGGSFWLVSWTPFVQILAPEAWWLGWCRMAPETRRDAGHWEGAIRGTGDRIGGPIGIRVECVSIQNKGLADISWDRQGPLLESAPSLRPVHLDSTPALGPALTPVSD